MVVPQPLPSPSLHDFFLRSQSKLCHGLSTFIADDKRKKEQLYQHVCEYTVLQSACIRKYSGRFTCEYKQLKTRGLTASFLIMHYIHNLYFPSPPFTPFPPTHPDSIRESCAYLSRTRIPLSSRAWYVRRACPRVPLRCPSRAGSCTGPSAAASPGGCAASGPPAGTCRACRASRTSPGARTRNPPRNPPSTPHASGQATWKAKST
jgi:hypothetical protein